MKASQKPLILVAALAAFPALALAAPTPEHGHRRAHGAAPPTPSSRPDRSLAQMDLAPRFYLKRPYATVAMATPGPETPVTAVSRQMSADGPIGSVGLINLAGHDAVQDRSFGDSLASLRGLPSRALGFNVSYNFP